MRRSKLLIATAVALAPIAAAPVSAAVNETVYTDREDDDDDGFDDWGLLGLLGLAGLLGRKRKDNDIHVDARRDNRS